jgi:hypothetical protein
VDEWLRDEESGEKTEERQESMLLTPEHREPAPRTVKEMYDTHYEGAPRSPKWRQQLLERASHMRATATDVAEIVLELDEAELSNMLAFAKAETTELYIAGEAGVWVLVEGKETHEVYAALTELTARLDRIVIAPLKRLVRRLRDASVDASRLRTPPGKQPMNLQEVWDAHCGAEAHLEDVVGLFERLRTPAFACGVVKRIMMMRVMATRDAGVRLSSLDTAINCVGFDDGVFDVAAGRLLRGSEARARYVTLSVGYEYEAVAALDAATEDDASAETSEASEYRRFMSRVYSSDPEVLPYLLDLLASSLLNENRQVIVFHHNVHRHAARVVQQDPRGRRHGWRHGEARAVCPLRIDLRVRRGLVGSQVPTRVHARERGAAL